MNYKIYHFKSKEICMYLAFYIAISSFTAWLFYDEMIAVLIALCISPILLLWRRKNLQKNRISILKKQFVEMTGSISSALSAGLSVENAIREAYRDMLRLYGEEADIVKELREMIDKSDIGINITDSLKDFADRTSVDDIKDFSIVFSEAVKSGGNLNQIIRDTVNVIETKSRMEEEIESMLKGKMLEQKVMSVIPFLIIVYLRITSAEFIACLYRNIAGICVMTVCLLTYIGALVLSEKIIDIKV